MLVWLGMFGLIASFHGIILGYSRQIFALARANYLPHWFAEVHPRFKTPHRAILAGGVVGIAAIYSDQLIQFGGQTLTANIVTMSVFGAIVMYITSMLSLFKLRKSEPGMERPFKAPFYPWFPLFALLGALICLGTMVYYNPAVAGVFFGMLTLGYIVFIAVKRERETAPLDEMLESAEEMQLERQLAAKAKAKA
jgi:ethanolamine permease